MAANLADQIWNDALAFALEQSNDCTEKHSIQIEERAPKRLNADLEIHSGAPIPNENNENIQSYSLKSPNKQVDLKASFFHAQKMDDAHLLNLPDNTEICETMKDSTDCWDQCNLLQSTVKSIKSKNISQNESLPFQSILERNVLQSIRNTFNFHQIDQYSFLQQTKKHLNTIFNLFDSLNSIDFQNYKKNIMAHCNIKNSSFDSVELKSAVKLLHKKMSLLLNQRLNLSYIEKALSKIERSFFNFLNLFIQRIDSKIREKYKKLSVEFTKHQKSHLEIVEQIANKISSCNFFLQQINSISTRSNQSASNKTLSSLSAKCTEADSLVEACDTPLKDIVVCFSGFNNDSTPSKEDLATIVTRLGGTVVLKGGFHDGISHVISPPSFPRTMRTLAALLLSKWVISQDWILACSAQNCCVDESNYGYKGNGSKFKGKKFHLSPEFFIENEKYYDKNTFLSFFKLIVKGILVENPIYADYVMVDKERANGINFLDWNQFANAIDVINNTDKESDC